MPQVFGIFQEIKFFSISCLTKSKPKGIVFAHINVCSLMNKTAYVFSYLTEKNIDVLSINETWLNSNISNSSLFFPGYYIFRLDRNYSSGGKVCILIKNCYIRVVENSLMSNCIELIHVMLQFPFSSHINVVSVYRKPIVVLLLILHSL